MSEEYIRMNKLEKNPARVAAGRRLSEYNKIMRDRQQSGKTSNAEETELNHDKNNSEAGQDGDSGGTNLTGIMILTGLACLAYYMYTTDKRSERSERSEEVKKDDAQHQQEQVNTIKDNNKKLRSFNN